MKRVFILSGESSGELYGALLSKKLKELYPGVEIYGIGGKRMAQCGVVLLGRITGAFGITEVIGSLRRLRKNLKKIKSALKELRPEIVVLIDFPDFNLKVASYAKQLGSRVLYYVSPQVWAWRKGRIHKIKALSDEIAVVLPFEEPLYKSIGAKATFVGHPIVEETMKTLDSDAKENYRRELNITDGETIALLPGSRTHELKRLLPVYADLVQRMNSRIFVLPLSENIPYENHRTDLDRLSSLGVRITKGKAVEALGVSDYAVVASGTATLQAALVGTPFVVVYKVSPLSYLIGRMLISVDFICLVNLIVGSEIVKELIQGEVTSERIQREIEDLRDPDRLQRISEAFRKIRETYLRKDASTEVAKMIGRLTGWR